MKFIKIKRLTDGKIDKKALLNINKIFFVFQAHSRPKDLVLLPNEKTVSIEIENEKTFQAVVNESDLNSITIRS